MPEKPDLQYTEYSFLASYYDEVMKDVDYEAWAEFLDDLIQLHHPVAMKVHELSCGTGSILIELDRFGTYDLSGSDKSEEMIQMARLKSDSFLSDLQFYQDDFRNLSKSGSFDVVLSVFDSLNYLLIPDEFEDVFSSVERILAPAGIFIFDFTTPAHSIASIEWLDNEKVYTKSGVRIVRRSVFDQESNLHTNHFSVFSLNKSEPHVKGEETHLQRAYSISEIEKAVHTAGWTCLASYSDFEFTKAHAESQRVCMVCKPQIKGQ